MVVLRFCQVCYLCDDDGGQVFEVLDVGEQRVSQCIVCLWWKLVEGRLDLHLHGLSSKVTRLHILFELQQLVRDLPCVHLWRGSDVITPEQLTGTSIRNQILVLIH